MVEVPSLLQLLLACARSLGIAVPTVAMGDEDLRFVQSDSEGFLRVLRWWRSDDWTKRASATSLNGCMIKKTLKN